MRRPIVAGNWKMNGSIKLIDEIVCGFSTKDHFFSKIDIILFPPATLINQLYQSTSTLNYLYCGAQDIDHHENGERTGQISAVLAKSAGSHYVLAGHSERREHQNETSHLVAKKTVSALRHNLSPIVCVGESLQQREQGRIEEAIGAQLAQIFSQISSKDFNKVIFAYEPIWAIGTGQAASPEQAQEVHDFIRKQINLNYPENINTTRILYGGSVKSNNVLSLLEKKDIDGVLVGGASLVSNDFLQICLHAENLIS